MFFQVKDIIYRWKGIYCCWYFFFVQKCYLIFVNGLCYMVLLWIFLFCFVIVKNILLLIFFVCL